MFGMGFMEIFLIAIVAIIALGPEKLPNAMVEIAKFLKKFKAGVEDAKSTLDNELNISEMKEEAARYKAQIENAKATLNVKEQMDLGLNDIINDDMEKPSLEEDKPKEKVSLKEPKKKKKKKKEEAQTQEKVEKTEKAEEKKEEKAQAVDDSGADAMNKFKVELEDFDGTEEIK